MTNIRRALIKALDEGVETGRCPHCGKKGAFINERVKCPQCGREIDETMSAAKGRDTAGPVVLPEPLFHSYNPTLAKNGIVSDLARRLAEQGKTGAEPLPTNLPYPVRKAVSANRAGFVALVKQFRDEIERATIVTPDVMKKSGTSEGAKRGWQTRRGNRYEDDHSADNIATHLDMIQDGKSHPNAEKIARIMHPDSDADFDERESGHEHANEIEQKYGVSLTGGDRQPFVYGHDMATKKLTAINSLLNEAGVNAYGVEQVTDDGEDPDYRNGNSDLSYVNRGDSYHPTIAYDHKREKFTLTSVGDHVEQNMKETPDGRGLTRRRVRKDLLSKSVSAMRLEKKQTSAGAIKAAETRRRNKMGGGATEPVAPAVRQAPTTGDEGMGRKAPETGDDTTRDVSTPKPRRQKKEYDPKVERVGAHPMSDKTNEHDATIDAKANEISDKLYRRAPKQRAEFAAHVESLKRINQHNSIASILAEEADKGVKEVRASVANRYGISHIGSGGAYGGIDASYVDHLSRFLAADDTHGLPRNPKLVEDAKRWRAMSDDERKSKANAAIVSAWRDSTSSKLKQKASFYKD